MPAGLDERWVAELEVKLGRRLPPSYRTKMQLANGGTVHAAQDHWELHPISDGTSPRTTSRTYPDVVYETGAAREWSSFPSSALAIAANGSGDRLVFIVGDKDSFGSVVLRWDHETGNLLPVANDFRELRETALAPSRRREPPLYQQTRGRRVASVSIPDGPTLASVPKPWRSIQPDGHRDALYRLQLGKKSGCWVDLYAVPLAELDPEREWRSFTELPDKGKFSTETEDLELAGRQLRLTWTWSSGWLPGWVRDVEGCWHGQFYSETRRLAGDLREIRQLLRAFDFGNGAEAGTET